MSRILTSHPLRVALASLPGLGSIFFAAFPGLTSWVILCRPSGATGQEDFGVVVGDGEEFQGGFAGAAGALLPAFYGVEADVDDAGEDRLADVEGLADGANLMRT